VFWLNGMMEPMLNQEQNQPQNRPSMPPSGGFDRKQIAKPAIIICVVLLVVMAILAGTLMMGGKDKPSEDSADNKSAGSQVEKNLFYKMMSNAMQKTTVKFEHYEFLDRTKEVGADSGLAIKKATSVAEIDDRSKTYSAVFAASENGLSAQKCIKNQGFEDSSPILGGFTEAYKSLSKPLVPASNLPSSIDPCNYKDSVRDGKLTDGILPFGLTKEQKDAWLGGVQESEVFVLQDKGRSTYAGKQVKKYSFKLNSGKTNSVDGTRLLSVFRSAVGQENAYKLDETFIGFDTIEGYYLIDEATELPVYSQLNATSEEGRKLSTKQEYSYPSALTLTRNSLPKFTR